MKKLLYILTLIPFLALGQSQDQNYIKTTTYKKASSEVSVDVTNPADAAVQVSYFDGLGRPIQQVAHKQSNSSKDIITHIEYDAFGRQTKEYLPFSINNQNIEFVDPATVGSELTSFYSSYNGGTVNPYSEKQLEASPLNRIMKQAAPGDAWAMNSGKEIKMEYQTNGANEVKLFTASATWNGTYGLFVPSIQDGGFYATNELYKTITKDENWTSGVNNTTEEFKNKEGQVVLKRTYNNSVAHDTYYVYDPFGNLTYVIPPLAEGNSSQATLDNLGYQYKYDSRNRLVEKKLPGKQWEFIIYDLLDRPLATGPAYTPYGGNTVGWMVTEYDVFGRVVQTGWKQVSVSSLDRKNYQKSINIGSNPLRLAVDDLILTKNYYDNYTYSGAPSPIPSQIEGKDLVSNVKGLPTGSWTKVLDATNPNAAETSYTLYDEYYRPVRMYTSNHLGGYTQVDSKLDWAGKTEYTITTHKYDTNATVLTVRDNFFYTAQDRLELHTQQINGGSTQLITKNTYDELGQLTSKNVGGSDTSGATGLQTVDYSYNIRGWLKGINDVNNLGTDLFAFKINYNTPEEAAALFNGNISETYWKSSNDTELRKYNYNYDHLNRLLGAEYNKPEASVPDTHAYNENLTYDKNGNILTLQRNGGMVGGFPNPIDDLQYTYDTNNKNRLVKVDDSTNSEQGYKDGINTLIEYEYDNNGNLTKDRNKYIQTITYNHLNLPTQVLFEDGNEIVYLYNAIGTKLVKKVTSTPEPTWNNPFPVAVTDITIYLNGFQYKNNELQFFPQPEGYVKKENNSYSYVFNYTDHLGNVRLSYSDIDGNGILGDELVFECFTDHKGNETCTDYLISSILEENHYYPFGLKHSGYNMNNNQPNYKYKYNGKELQDELGLNMYDYGARNYDPALGRWMNIDPLAENSRRWTPYNYAYNNPMYFVDPDGMQADDWRNKKGQVVYNTDASKGPVGYTEFATRNDKRLGASLQTTERGRNQFDKLINSSQIVTVEVNLGADIVRSKKDGGYLPGVTNTQYDAASDPFTGKVEEIVLKDADITINVATIEFILDGLNKGTIKEKEYGDYKGLSFDEMLGVVFGHEIEHITEENAKTAEEGGDFEKIPTEIGKEIAKEIKENKK